MTTQVIVLNGGSSSGTSGIVRCLQAVLRDPWLAAAVDSLIEAMPASLQTSEAEIEFAWVTVSVRAHVLAGTGRRSR